MSLRDQLPRIIAGDPRYAIDAYAFVLEALNQARNQKLKAQTRERERERDEPKTAKSREDRRPRKSGSGQRAPSGHVTGAELCHAVRKLALRQYGLLAATVLNHWGIRSTADIGEIVYNMIATGDLEKTDDDSRSDFNNVFDFDKALRPRITLAEDDTTRS
jgi:uncharacterized repeat protein (TIGR04138 family)